MTTEMKKNSGGSEGRDLNILPWSIANLHKSKEDEENKRCKSRRTPSRFQAVHLFEWGRSQLGDHFTRFVPLHATAGL